MIDEDHGLVESILTVSGRGDAEGHVVGEGRARQAMIGHAIRVVAAGGLELEAARAPFRSSAIVISDSPLAFSGSV